MTSWFGAAESCVLECGAMSWIKFQVLQAEFGEKMKLARAAKDPERKHELLEAAQRILDEAIALIDEWQNELEEKQARIRARTV